MSYIQSWRCKKHSVITVHATELIKVMVSVHMQFSAQILHYMRDFRELPLTSGSRPGFTSLCSGVTGNFRPTLLFNQNVF